MNEMTLTELGGLPLTQNDLNFLQNSYKEAFKGLLSGLANYSNPGYILSGCTVYLNGGTNTLWVTEGFVVIKVGNFYAEIFYVPNHNLNVPNGTVLKWVEAVTNVAPSPVTFKNLTVKNVHKQRRLTLSTSVFNLGAYADTPKWIDVLRSDLLTPAPAWVAVPTLGQGWVSVGFAYAKTLDGKVFFKGRMTHASTPAGGVSTVLAMDVNHRATGDRYISANGCWNNGARLVSVPATIRFNTSGIITVEIEGGVVDASITFEGLSFYKS